LQGFSEAGGVYVNENFKTEVSVSNSTFVRNFGGYGGAMSLYDSNVMLQNCSYASNEVRFVLEFVSVTVHEKLMVMLGKCSIYSSQVWR
jgi:hypothetical protein